MRPFFLFLLFIYINTSAQDLLNLNPDLKVFIPGMNAKGEISAKDFRSADTMYLIGEGAGHFFLKSCEISMIVRGNARVFFANSSNGVKINQIRPDKLTETKTRITLHKMRVFNLKTKKYCDIPSQTIIVNKAS